MPRGDPGNLPAPSGRGGWPWSEVDVPADVDPPGGWPRITVVTPSFNQGGLVEETIRSVLLQRYPNLEYLVMDGGSTDATVEVLRRYGPWLDHWQSEPDGGQASAINGGWRRGTGELLAWLNSDDTFAPGALRTIGRAWLAAGRPSIVYGDAAAVDASGRVLGVKVLDAPRLDDLLSVRHLPQPATFLSRAAQQGVGWLDESLQFALDFDYFLRVAVAGATFHHVPVIVACSREYAGTKSSTGGDRLAAERWAVLEALFARPEAARWRHLRTRARAAVRWRRALDRWRRGRRGAALADALRVALTDPRSAALGAALRNRLPRQAGGRR
jgi:glycosyltransferase involved in cell wall biosynthesis